MMAKVVYLRNELCNAQNNEISPNLPVWKFYGNAIFAIRPKLCGNSAFSQNLHTRKLGDIAVFYTVMRPRIK